MRIFESLSATEDTLQDPLRIFHFIYDHAGNPWVGGGGAVRAYELNRRLARRGHLITTVSGNYPGAGDYEEDGLSFKFVGKTGSYLASTLSYAVSAARFLRNHRDSFDLAVEDFAPWNPLFSRFLTSKPVILHVNHIEGRGILRRHPGYGLPFYLVEKFYPRLFAHVTALSETTRAKLKSPQALVLPAGIRAELLSRKSMPEEDYILFLGRLHIRNKGLDTLFEAMKSARDTRLVLAGRGADEERLKKMAGVCGIKAEFMGYADEEKKLDALGSAKLLVLPSRFEGWGIVVMEAAACGKPVVVSDIPELDFSVKAGFGVSFRSGDAKDLGEKIKQLTDDASLRSEMGARARQYAKDFTWDVISRRYESFLLAVMNGRD